MFSFSRLKHTLGDEGRLCVFRAGLCSLPFGCTWVPKNIERLAIPALNRQIVVVQSPVRFLGIVGGNKISLTPNQHCCVDFIRGRGLCQKLGPRHLTQTSTYLRWAQNSSMVGRQRARHSQMYRCGPRCGGALGRTIVQSSLCRFMKKPQSFMWQLHLTIDNVSRQGTMQHQKTCQMATHIMLRLNGGNTRVQLQKQDHEKNPKPPPHFFRWCGRMPCCLAIKYTTTKSSMVAPTLCGSSHRGFNLMQSHSHVRAINKCQLAKSYTCAVINSGAKDISMDTTCKTRCAHHSTKSCLRRCRANGTFHKQSRKTPATSFYPNLHLERS